MNDADTRDLLVFYLQYNQEEPKMEMINEFWLSLQSLNAFQISIVALALGFVWFLPGILAVVLNPAHAKYIFVACVPAGFSIIAWSGLMIWACTGKVFDRYKDKVEQTS